jgi:hypothetical protein
LCSEPQASCIARASALLSSALPDLASALNQSPARTVLNLMNVSVGVQSCAKIAVRQMGHTYPSRWTSMRAAHHMMRRSQKRDSEGLGN